MIDRFMFGYGFGIWFISLLYIFSIPEFAVCFLGVMAVASFIMLWGLLSKE